VYLPASSGPWRQFFEGSGLQIRDYADGSVRITVGSRQSTRAVLSALRPFASR
jgi:histidinol-phosphate aminotransferase